MFIRLLRRLAPLQVFAVEVDEIKTGTFVGLEKIIVTGRAGSSELTNLETRYAITTVN